MRERELLSQLMENENFIIRLSLSLLASSSSPVILNNYLHSTNEAKLPTLSIIVISSFPLPSRPPPYIFFCHEFVEINGWLWIGHKLNTSVINIAFAKNCLSFSPTAGIYSLSIFTTQKHSRFFFFMVEFEG